MLVLSRRELEELVPLPLAITAVEHAFAAYSAGRAQVYPVVRESLGAAGVWGVKSGMLTEPLTIGLKAAGYWPANRDRGLEPHQGVVVILEHETGRTKLVCDGNYVTYIRTAAAGALALRYLARHDAHSVALLGAGVQARGQLEAVLHALPGTQEIRCFDLDSRASRRFAHDALVAHGIKIEMSTTARQAVEGADVIITSTPSRSALVEDAWIAPGTHISALGADTKGKQELAPELVARSVLVVDDLTQAKEIGESQHAFALGLIGDVYATIGDIAGGAKPGRMNASDITVFDATGIALQDLAVAAVALARASELGIGIHLEL